MKKQGKKPRRETQAEMIYSYVQMNGQINPEAAFLHLGITKLATRISEMIRSGKYTVKKTPRSYTDKDGRKVRYMEYSHIVKKRRPKNESK